MIKKMLLLLVLAYLGRASAAESTDRVGNKELPFGAVLLCSEHVVGESSGKPMHIDWQAFGLDDEMEKTVQFYQSLFGQPPATEGDGQSYIWTFKGEYNELHYAVKTPTADGPWSQCPKHADFKSVILISNAIWVRGH